PSKTLIGSDSHTPTCGAVGMLSIGVGGLDVAVVMGGSPYYLKMPKIVGVELLGRLKPWVTAKDVILEMLRRLSVRGGIEKIFEYFGEGVKTLSVPERATICNMGAELGATTSIFPSDERTKEYFKMQERLKDFKPLAPDDGASYDERIVIDLSELEPLITLPSSPDNVKRVSEVEGIEAQQVIIGSCTNSSYKELMMAAKVLKGKKVSEKLSFHIVPGSRQVLENVARSSGLVDLISAGARIMEIACDGCIGMGSSPASNSVSVRSFNRNWPGRSGTMKDQVYLTSPETCVATALYGKITDPRRLGSYPKIDMPEKFVIDDSMIIPPLKNPGRANVIRGPNIKRLPEMKPLERHLEGEVLLKVGDNISTDTILPAGPKILPLRSNIPRISEFVFVYLDLDFSKRARERNGGFVVGGENYGQGSSREHAALAPKYLGVKGVIAKSFSRIHKSNLLNFGILPLEFSDQADYERVRKEDFVEIRNARQAVEREKVISATISGRRMELEINISQRQRKIALAGGLLNYVRLKHEEHTISE
ncbi:MAG: aconitate hydratase, partial [Candidatus Methanofastidiosia archaeon]